tara:strand:+ start:8621 stop:11743 length:3123 start_codon:yes stop_codon:yes gene_type:complete
MIGGFNEDVVEQASLAWFEGLGYSIAHGPEIAPQSAGSERADYSEVLLVDRLRNALFTLNPDVPAECLEGVIRQLQRPDQPTLIENNRTFHSLLRDGVDVEYRLPDGSSKGDKIWLFDFENPDRNDWLVVNQFTVVEKIGANQHDRRPDVVVFVNGIPLAVIELKNAADEDADIWTAYKQLQTYKAEIPSLFVTNSVLLVSDGLDARIGSLTAGKDRFTPWRTADGEEAAPKTQPQLDVAIKGIFDRRWFLDYVRNFTVFETNDEKIIKKIAAYHQFHAVRKAIGATVTATEPSGDKRAGVIWHTQGSGKSLTMLFYAGRLIEQSELENPTVVVLTDRNDLDGQLFSTFAEGKAILRQTPDQAADRTSLRDLLKRASGGVIFTTIQKFLPDERASEHPLLSDRRNIIVIADEAHRSQYGFKAKIDKETGQIGYGFAKYCRDALPNATFIAFTGTPVERTDVSTRGVFGNEIDVYDIEQAIEDNATVPIYYEGRLVKLGLDAAAADSLDEELEELTEGEEDTSKEKLKTRWAALEAIVGSDERIKQVAEDIVAHFEDRQSAMEGKAMVVAMSRRICMALHDAIVELRPDWYHDDDDKGVIKVVMTGNASEGPEIAKHARNKSRREDLAKRFKDPNDPLKLVIVRDMWLTGFDCPCMHTLYIDKPMRGHGLMQAIARVNRVFRDKPGGLVVDYIGIADQLKKALATYTESGGQGRTTVDQDEAVAIMQEKYEVVVSMYHGFDHSRFFSDKASERMAVIPEAIEHILALEDGKSRYLQAVLELSKAFALAVPHEKALAIRDDVGFFQAVRAGIVKATVPGSKSPEDLDTAVRQIVSKAVASQGVVDIFASAGLKNPDISILSDEFLADVQNMPQKNLALEMLRKLINDEIKVRSRKNIVQARSFREMLEGSIKKYQNRGIETAEVLQELIDLAQRMQEAKQRGEQLGLNESEEAFYDALANNKSAVEDLGDETLKTIARELADRIRKSATIDWTIKDTVRAEMRAMVRRLLRKYKYPPDQQEAATDLILSQAETLAESYSNGA